MFADPNTCDRRQLWSGTQVVSSDLSMASFNRTGTLCSGLRLRNFLSRCHLRQLGVQSSSPSGNRISPHSMALRKRKTRGCQVATAPMYTAFSRDKTPMLALSIAPCVALSFYEGVFGSL